MQIIGRIKLRGALVVKWASNLQSSRRVLEHNTICKTWLSFTQMWAPNISDSRPSPARFACSIWKANRSKIIIKTIK